MVAYAYIRGYALVSGDPIGPPGSIGRVLDEFLAHCRRQGWRIAFLAVREADIDLYEARGFTASTSATRRSSTAASSPSRARG